jgi:hypothetical protein
MPLSIFPARLIRTLGAGQRLKTKLMKPTLIATIFFLPFMFSSHSRAQSRSIYGAYQDCPFNCRTININPDHTFEYVLGGDLYNSERIKGKWSFIGKDRIKATSPEDYSPPHVTEKFANRGSSFVLMVSDPAEAAVKGAVISGVANGSTFKVTTDDEGVALIPKVNQFEIAFNGYRGVHRVSNTEADEFLVTLTFEQMANWAIDQVWLIEGPRLYVALPDGNFDRRFWLGKLSGARERKVLH